MSYEKLLNEADDYDIYVHEEPMKPKIRGLYSDEVIWINKVITSTNEKSCVLAEELGHYHTSSGNILDMTKLESRKQENQARSWAHKKLIPLTKIIDAYKEGSSNRYELAEYLGVTEEFLLEAINSYKVEYGIYAKVDRYIIYFEPLAVLELFE